jgi:hypothetical protein
LLSVFWSEKNCAINIQHAVVLIIVGKQKIIVFKTTYPASARTFGNGIYNVNGPEIDFV